MNIQGNYNQLFQILAMLKILPSSSLGKRIDCIIGQKIFGHNTAKHATTTASTVKLFFDVFSFGVIVNYNRASNKKNQRKQLADACGNCCQILQ